MLYAHSSMGEGLVNTLMFFLIARAFPCNLEHLKNDSIKKCMHAINKVHSVYVTNDKTVPYV